MAQERTNKNEGIPMSLHPSHDGNFRWLPRMGMPTCIGEWFMQKVFICLAWAPLYTAIVVTIMSIVFVFTVLK